MRYVNHLKRLPISIKVALAFTCFLFVLNVVWAFSAESHKIDPGTATLLGAIVGLGIIGWQARLGFLNLVKSQRNQSELDREARLHQSEIERAREETSVNERRNILANALWAETYALYFQAAEQYVAHKMFGKVAEEMERRREPPVLTNIGFPSFDAPVYKANIPNLGLLPPGITADVVLVMTRAKGGEPYKTESERPLSHSLTKTLHHGFADTMKDWRDDLFHVSKRLASIINPSNPDPGSLYEAQKVRKETKKAREKT